MLRIALICIMSISLPLAGLGQQAGAGEESAGAERNGSKSSATDYVLQPQDVMRVQVFQEEDINKQGEVSISGEHTVTLPLIGTINLEGLTVREAEEKIRELYDRDYIVNPQVSVIVLKYSDRSVNVIGAVNTAGRVQFPQERGLTIIEALSLAGGHSRLANLKNVKLTRKNETIEVDVSAMMKGGGRDSVHLEPGDVVFVPERIL